MKAVLTPILHDPLLDLLAIFHGRRHFFPKHVFYLTTTCRFRKKVLIQKCVDKIQHFIPLFTIQLRSLRFSFQFRIVLGGFPGIIVESQFCLFHFRHAQKFPLNTTPLTVLLLKNAWSGVSGENYVVRLAYGIGDTYPASNIRACTTDGRKLCQTYNG